MIPALCTLIAFFIFLLLEKLFLWQARKYFSLVIHVNGTRGKSTVTRMIHALLREQGMEVYGKTTGSTARLLLPDGSEKPIRRFGSANVREQRNMLLLSACMVKKNPVNKKTALVFECNAVQEELQHISMRYLKPDITIITNVRQDHAGELGTPDKAAGIFASAIPKNTVLITSEEKYLPVFKKTAEEKNFSLFFHQPITEVTSMETSSSVETPSSTENNFSFPDNNACVFGLASHLGIEEVTVLNTLSGYTSDAGAYREYSFKEGMGQDSKHVYFADARAVNDVESAEYILSKAFKKNLAEDPATGTSSFILLLVNREDRPERTLDFLQFIINMASIDNDDRIKFNKYISLGHNPLYFRKKLKEAGVEHEIISGFNDLDKIINGVPQKNINIFAMGNYGGKGKQIDTWLKQKINRGKHAS